MRFFVFAHLNFEHPHTTRAFTALVHGIIPLFLVFYSLGGIGMYRDYLPDLHLRQHLERQDRD